MATERSLKSVTLGCQGGEIDGERRDRWRKEKRSELWIMGWRAYRIGADRIGANRTGVDSIHASKN